MKTRTTLTICLEGLSLLLSACYTRPIAVDAVLEETQPVEMTEEEMMAAMMKMAAVGEGHELLKQLEGDWQADGKLFMSPDAPPTGSTGTMTNRLILGGRYLVGDYQATLPMGPFEGMSIMGFDNSRKMYVGTWMDSWSTWILPLSHGTYDPATKTLSMSRMMEDAMRGGMVEMRDTTTIVNENEHHFKMYEKRPGQPETMVFEIIYTRKP